MSTATETSPADAEVHAQQLDEAARLRDAQSAKAAQIRLEKLARTDRAVANLIEENIALRATIEELRARKPKKSD